MSNNSSIFADTFQHPLCESQRLATSGHPLGSASRSPQQDPVLLGDSVAVRRLRSQVQRIAPYFRTALIRGEIGSGKQQVARSLHALSPVADGPFIVVNATAIAQSVANNETVNSPSVASLFESAQEGTLYLDRIGELPFALQSALLRLLYAFEDRRTTTASTLGSSPSNPRPAATHSQSAYSQNTHSQPTRILAATDRDLRILAAIGQFHQDLYARLATVEILVPPLRQRSEDISILCAWLLHRLAQQTGQPPKQLSDATLRQLQNRPWPNNLRELERVVVQAASLAEDGPIEPRHLLALVEPTSPARPSAIRVERLQDVIQQHVLDVLTRCGGNKLRAAELLGISRSTLYRMLDACSVSPHSRTG